MSRRVLILGEAPGARTDPSRPLGLDGESGRRLRALAGDALGRARLANLLGEWPGGCEGKGSAFPADDARAAAIRALAEVVPRFGLVVALGTRVWRALGLPASDPWFARRELRAGKSGRATRVAMLFPHPSGISHYWNEPSRVAAARAKLLEALR